MSHQKLDASKIKLPSNYGKARLEVKRNMEFIQESLEQGYTRRSIYLYLKEEGEVTVTERGFTSAYRQLISPEKTQAKTSSKKSSSPSQPKKSVVHNPVATDEDFDELIGIDPKKKPRKKSTLEDLI